MKVIICVLALATFARVRSASNLQDLLAELREKRQPPAPAEPTIGGLASDLSKIGTSVAAKFQVQVVVLENKSKAVGNQIMTLETQIETAENAGNDVTQLEANLESLEVKMEKYSDASEIMTEMAAETSEFFIDLQGLTKEFITALQGTMGNSVAVRRKLTTKRLLRRILGEVV